MNQIPSPEIAGSVVRRVREECGISRADLAKKCNIGARSIYALEMGEAENFGLGRFLSILDALGLTMSIDFASSGTKVKSSSSSFESSNWSDLSETWQLDKGLRNEY